MNVNMGNLGFVKFSHLTFSYLFSAMLGLVLPAHSAFPAHHEETGEHRLSGAEIIDKYQETRTVDSELVYVRMAIVLPGPAITERRFLAAYRKEPQGGHGYFIRLVRPKEVEGVTLLAVEDASGDATQYLYLPSVGKTTTISKSGRSGAFLGFPTGRFPPSRIMLS